MDDMRLLSGNQVVIDRKPVIINVSYHGGAKQPWERTPDYYDHQFDRSQTNHQNHRSHRPHQHNGYYDANYNRSCYGRHSLGDWYNQNEMVDADPSTTIDGDRNYLTGRRWRHPRHYRESMTNSLMEDIPQQQSKPVADHPLQTMPPENDRSQPVRQFADPSKQNYRSWSNYRGK